MKRKVLTLLLACSLPSVATSANIEDGWIQTHDGYKLFYQKLGTGPQKVIIPLRLFTLAALTGLAGPKRTLVFYDTRNRGRSQRIEDVAAITLQNDVRDLETVRAHFGFQRIIPVGWSYAGMMVVLYAAEHPGRVEKVVQLGPVPPTFGTKYPAEYDNSGDRSYVDPSLWNDIRQWREQGRDKTEPKAFCVLWQRLSARSTVYKAERAQWPGEDFCAMENEWPVNFERHLQAHFVGSVQNFKFPVAELKRIKAPVLTIHGLKDRNAPYGAGREWAVLLPNARLLTLTDAAHAVWADEPKLTTDAIDAFLRGKWPRLAENIVKR
jgi:pimeloyl-ACP methyl ester carboxylesterase